MEFLRGEVFESRSPGPWPRARGCRWWTLHLLCTTVAFIQRPVSHTRTHARTHSVSPPHPALSGQHFISHLDHHDRLPGLWLGLKLFPLQSPERSVQMSFHFTLHLRLASTTYRPTEQICTFLRLGSHRVRHDWSDLAAVAARWLTGFSWSDSCQPLQPHYLHSQDFRLQGHWVCCRACVYTMLYTTCCRQSDVGAF